MDSDGIYLGSTMKKRTNKAMTRVKSEVIMSLFVSLGNDNQDLEKKFPPSSLLSLLVLTLLVLSLLSFSPPLLSPSSPNKTRKESKLEGGERGRPPYPLLVTILFIYVCFIENADEYLEGAIGMPRLKP